MTIVTSTAFVHIITSPLVFSVGVRFIMVVTVDTGEIGIIRWLFMAIGAGVPFAAVGSRINGERLPVVAGITCRRPSGRKSMTFVAVGSKTKCTMVGGWGGFVRRFVAIVAVCLNVSVGFIAVARKAIDVCMSPYQREKPVFKARCQPFGCM